MALKIASFIVLALVLFLAYVASRPANFRYERSGIIHATPERIYSFVSDLRKGNLWSPYVQKDPSMKIGYSGAPTGVGSRMDFESEKAGSGIIEMTQLVPFELVEQRLTMTKPFKGINLVEYKLKPVGSDTQFSWTMSGESGFIGKLMATIVDTDKLIAGDFEIGIANLKRLAEGKDVD